MIDNLEQQKQENLKLEQMKVEFLRGASHELKTPLASLKIILENMRDKIGRYKDRDRYLSVSLDIVDEMNQIVLEILSLSSVQELAGDKEWIQLDQVLEQILDQYKVLAQSLRSRLTIKSLTKQFIWTQRFWKLVLSNVISNAVKHSDVGGEIQLRLEEEGTHLAVENTSQEMVETAEIPMTASRQKKEGGLGSLWSNTCWTMKNWPTNLIKQLWAYASVWNCLKILKNKNREWDRNRSFVRIRFRRPTSAQLSRAVKADEISAV